MYRLSYAQCAKNSANDSNLFNNVGKNSAAITKGCPRNGVFLNCIFDILN